MNTTSALTIAQSLSLVTFLVIAVWYVVPWLKVRSRVDALTPLIWVHAFRNLALHLYSAQQSGLAIPDSGRDHAVLGDVVGMLLALVAVASLRYRMRFATAIVWLLVLETLIDIGIATVDGIQGHTMGLLNGITWLILVYYVPLMLVCLGLTVWQLVSRRSESLKEAGRTKEQRREMPNEAS